MERWTSPPSRLAARMTTCEKYAGGPRHDVDLLATRPYVGSRRSRNGVARPVSFISSGLGDHDVTILSHRLR